MSCEHKFREKSKDHCSNISNSISKRYVYSNRVIKAALLVLHSNVGLCTGYRFGHIPQTLWYTLLVLSFGVNGNCQLVFVQVRARGGYKSSGRSCQGSTGKHLGFVVVPW